MLIIILLVLICIFCWMWFIKSLDNVDGLFSPPIVLTGVTTTCVLVAIGLAIYLSNPRAKTVEELRAGYSNTSTIPLGRSGKLSEVANTVCFMLSDRSGYTTGVTLNLAGGKTRG